MNELGAIERALLQGRAESLTISSNVFWGVTICPVVVGLTWLLWGDKSTSFFVAELVFWISAFITTIATWLCVSLEKLLLPLAKDDKVNVRNIFGGQSEVFLRRAYNHEKFTRLDFQRRIRLARAARVLCYAVFVMIGSLVSLFIGL
jgi:hypothetical protein